MRKRHRGGRRAVPFKLAAAVQIDVDVAAHDRHRLGARRAHRDELGAEFSATVRASAAGRVRLTARRGRAAASGSGPARSVASRMPPSSPGSATAPTVGTPSIASATCTAQSLRPSPYSRVPSSGSMIHTRRLAEALGGILRLFLEQDAVIGPVRSNLRHQPGIGAQVTLGPNAPSGQGLGPHACQPHADPSGSAPRPLPDAAPVRYRPSTPRQEMLNTNPTRSCRAKSRHQPPRMVSRLRSTRTKRGHQRRGLRPPL